MASLAKCSLPCQKLFHGIFSKLPRHVGSSTELKQQNRKWCQSRFFSATNPQFGQEQVFEKIGTTKLRTVTEVSRLINPSDANPVGFMHGGKVLSLLEEAGVVAATRHINLNRGLTDLPLVAVLVRMEKVQFLRPIQIGDVVDADSEITFTSDRSCEVRVTVRSVGMFRGDPERRLSTMAFLWFVAAYIHPETQALTASRMMPPVKMTPEEHKSGIMRYNKQKSDRVHYAPSKSQPPVFIAPPNPTMKLFDTDTVRSSQSTYMYLVNLDDCDMFKNMRGGAIMKLADELAGITAFRHCKNNCVTATVDACNFNRSIPLGAYVYMDGYMTYTSGKSMEVEIVVHAGWVDLATGETVMVYNVVNAIFTFVSIDGKGRPLNVRELKLETDDERKVFEEGQKRHELRVKDRKAR